MTGATKSDMAAFGASDAACYSYPEDTAVAKAQRAAFRAGAAWSADEIERLLAICQRADYYINRLEAAHRGHVVRDLDEAYSAWESAKARAAVEQTVDR